jgi:plastocyanin
MNRGIPALAACAALALSAGCGSSSTPATASSPAPASTPSSSLKVTTTPRYGAPSSSSPIRSGTVQVAYRNIAISPDTLRVRVGTTIRWMSYDTVEHNVTSASGPQRFVSKTIREGGSFEVKLTKPGVIHYQCTFHPASMNGTIAVLR